MVRSLPHIALLSVDRNVVNTLAARLGAAIEQKITCERLGAIDLLAKFGHLVVLIAACTC
jgi:hypothetical protein